MCVWGFFFGGGISFALLTTDHKNTKGSKDEMGRGITATPGVAEHGGVSRRGVGWEMGGILGVLFGLVLLRGLGIEGGAGSCVILVAS